LGVCVLGIVLLRGPIDTRVALWAHARKDTTLKPISDAVGKLGLSTWWLVGSGLLWLLGTTLAKRPTLARQAKLVFLALGVSGLLSIAAKLGFGEARPREWLDGGRYGFHWFVAPNAYDLQGFPSGHATTVFSLAASLALLWPRCRLLVLFVATVVGLSRIGNSYHFPSDVVAGALLGSSVAYLLHKKIMPAPEPLSQASAADGFPRPETSLPD
jgi:undecaprenyl-diphosphatase